MRKILIITLVFLVPCVCLGQFKIKTNRSANISTLDDPAGRAQGLVSLVGLDPSRFSMSQSYQVGYLSSGSRGFSQGMYLNTMTYEFSIPLLVSVQWGIASQPLSGFGTSPLMKSGPFISGTQLLYKPWKNTFIKLEYSQIPNSNSYGGLYNRYNRYRWFDDDRF